MKNLKLMAVISVDGAIEDNNKSLWDIVPDHLHYHEKNINGNLVTDDLVVYEKFINIVDEVHIVWINKMYPEASKRFPIDTLFKNFILIEDSGWKKDDSGTGYKVTLYKKIQEIL